MGKLVRLAVLTFLALAILAFAPGYARAQLVVENVRLGLHPDKTRMVLDLSEKTDFRTFVLPDPYRLVVELPTTDWRAAGQLSGAKQLLGEPSHEAVGDSGSRITFHAAGPIEIANAFTLPSEYGRPNRLVIDLKQLSHIPVSQEETRIFGGLKLPTPKPPAPAPQAAIPQAALPGSVVSDMPAPPAAPEQKLVMNTVTSALALPSRPDVDIPLPLAKPSRPLIVLDPGHGGEDPGATAKNGLYEKHITLKMARELKAALEKTGRYRVRLTRDSDRYLKLYQRVDVARHADADMFISLHADSVERGQARGASFYTLSENASDTETERLAADENRADAIFGVDLSHEEEEVASILIDLAMRDNMNQSRMFANFLADDFRRHNIRVLSQAHRHAGFAVLKAAEIPSVLIELGFISNPEEARLLNSPGHRAGIAAAIIEGIDSYFSRMQALHR